MSYYCERCDRWFVSEYDISAHEENSSAHNLCCGKDFIPEYALEEHWIQSSNHFHCRPCEEHFGDDDELEDHNDECHYYCHTCRKTFYNQNGLDQHLRQAAIHQRQVTRYRCRECNKDFASESNLRAHMNSKVHRDSDLYCPGYDAAFISRSTLVLRAESGECPSGVDRARVNKFIRDFDKNHLITDPARMITNGDQTVTYSASRATWNGSAYECYPCHNEFRTLHSLDQHLASPRHQDKMYLCPLDTCRVRFVTLSGLLQHIESERCGVTKFRSVQAALDGITSRVSRLAISY